jgi:hypothetical protein
MKNDESLSHIIFYGHRVWSVPANNVKLVARLTKAAIATHENANKDKEENDET